MAIVNGVFGRLYEFLSGAGGEDNIVNGSDSALVQGLLGKNKKDTLNGGDHVSNQTMFGRNGDDILNGGHYFIEQTLDGGNDDDTLNGGDFGTKQILLGQKGIDHINGGDSVDYQELNGGDDNDFIKGGFNVGVQIIHGGKGRDDIFAGTAETVEIYGESGRDIIHGSAGAGDILEGGTDDDFMFDSDANADYIDGGEGKDTLSFIYSRNGIIMGLGSEANSFTTQFGDTLLNFEKFYASRHDDHLLGDVGKHFFKGYEGNDIIEGGADADIIWGGADADTFIYRHETDSTQDLTGFEQDKLVDFETGVDVIHLSDSFATAENLVITSFGGDYWEVTVSGTDFNLRTHEQVNLSDIVIVPDEII